MGSIIRNFSFPFSELNLKPHHIEEAIGYENGKSPEPFPDLISFALSQSTGLAEIKVSLLISNQFSLDKSGSLNVDGVAFLTGKKIGRQLKNAEGGALFICTAGAGIGDKSKILMGEGFLLEGYILDVIGSLAVEAAIEK